jgi:hypothetical protein
LRICLVTPFSWSQPHDVNEHVAGLAGGLRELGHSVTVLAPSGRAVDLVAGRRALQDGIEADFVALGPALPISRRSRIGVPVGVRANLALALARGGFDVVHGFEPGLPSLSYLALLEARALSAATFFSPERLSYPPSRAQRERLLGRTDVLLAVSDAVAEAADERFPGEYRVVSPGIDLDLFAPGEKRKLAVVEWRPGGRTLARTAVRVLPELPEWELVILRTKPLSGRPTIRPSLRDRVRVRTLRDGRSRAAVFAETPRAREAGGAGGRSGAGRSPRSPRAAGARNGRAGATRRGRGPAGTGGPRRTGARGEPGFRRRRSRPRRAL